MADLVRTACKRKKKGRTRSHLITKKGSVGSWVEVGSLINSPFH